MINHELSFQTFSLDGDKIAINGFEVDAAALTEVSVRRKYCLNFMALYVVLALVLTLLLALVMFLADLTNRWLAELLMSVLVAATVTWPIFGLHVWPRIAEWRMVIETASERFEIKRLSFLQTLALAQFLSVLSGKDFVREVVRSAPRASSMLRAILRKSPEQSDRIPEHFRLLDTGEVFRCMQVFQGGALLGLITGAYCLWAILEGEVTLACIAGATSAFNLTMATCFAYRFGVRQTSTETFVSKVTDLASQEKDGMCQVRHKYNHNLLGPFPVYAIESGDVSLTIHGLFLDPEFMDKITSTGKLPLLRWESLERETLESWGRR